jgi:CPA1 family monovalent cation:H+ antiporter
MHAKRRIFVPIPNLILMFMVMLFVAVLATPIARRFALPFGALLVVGGFVGSEFAVAAGFDLGLRWYHVHDLVFYLLLPVLIFESALNLDPHLLLRNLVPILILAIPVLLLSTGVTGLLLYYGIGHSDGFPLIAALLAGALLSATDPVAVLDLFKKIDAPKRLHVLIEGESLFNDATAIVLFGLMLALSETGGTAVSLSETILQFLGIFFGGIGVGIVAGLFSQLLFRIQCTAVVQGAISIISAYCAFFIAEEFFGVSGIMAVLVTGLSLGMARRSRPERYHSFLGELWTFNAYVANALIFLLMGVTVTLGMFEERWLAMLIGIGAVLAARAIGIFGIMPLVSRLPGVAPIGAGYRFVMFWGGLRGAVALALALSLPLELEYWFTVQSIAYGVVLFTLFIQAPTLLPLIRRLRLNET